jgi:hypothetical protein
MQYAIMQSTKNCEEQNTDRFDRNIEFQWNQIDCKLFMEFTERRHISSEKDKKS